MNRFIENRSILSLNGNVSEREMGPILSGSSQPTPPNDHMLRNSKYNGVPQDTYTGKIDNNQEMFAAFDDDDDSDDGLDYEPSFSDSPQNAAQGPDQEGPADELQFDKELVVITTAKSEDTSSSAVNGVPISSDHFLQTSVHDSSDSDSDNPTSHAPSRHNADDFSRNSFQTFQSPATSNSSKSKSESYTQSKSSRTLPTKPKPGKDNPRNSSLDAFEASFENTFPPTFSSSFDDPPPLSIAFDVPEFNDPFFLGSLDLGSDDTGGNAFGELNSSAFEPSKSKRGNERFPVRKTTNKQSLSTTQSDPNNKISPASNKSLNSSKSDNKASDSKFGEFQESSLDFFPPSSMDVFDFTDDANSSQFDKNVTLDNSFETTRVSQPPPENMTNNGDSSPSLPKKSVSNLSRARFNAMKNEILNGTDNNSSGSKVFENRSNDVHTNDQKNEVEQQATPTSNSSRRILQRKNQLSKNGSPSSSKIKESLRASIAAVTSSASKSSFKASASSSSNGTGSKNSGRRNVRHPVSYAEPALNSKIRRGHEFFPKKESSSEANKQDRKETDSYDDILKDLASSSVIHNVT